MYRRFNMLLKPFQDIIEPKNYTLRLFANNFIHKHLIRLAVGDDPIVPVDGILNHAGRTPRLIRELTNANVAWVTKRTDRHGYGGNGFLPTKEFWKSLIESLPAEVDWKKLQTMLFIDSDKPKTFADSRRGVEMRKQIEYDKGREPLRFVDCSYAIANHMTTEQLLMLIKNPDYYVVRTSENDEKYYLPKKLEDKAKRFQYDSLVSKFLLNTPDFVATELYDLEFILDPPSSSSVSDSYKEVIYVKTEDDNSYKNVHEKSKALVKSFQQRIALTEAIEADRIKEKLAIGAEAVTKRFDTWIGHNAALCINDKDEILKMISRLRMVGDHTLS